MNCPTQDILEFANGSVRIIIGKLILTSGFNAVPARLGSVLHALELSRPPCTTTIRMFVINYVKRRHLLDYQARNRCRVGRNPRKPLCSQSSRILATRACPNFLDQLCKMFRPKQRQSLANRLKNEMRYLMESVDTLRNINEKKVYEDYN